MFVIRDYTNIPDPCRGVDDVSGLAQLAPEQHLQLPLLPYFNPRIEMRSRKMMGEFEACLSDPWFSCSPLVRPRNVAFVARPYTIGISYTDGYGKYRETELSGWPAQVFQHEYDHLDGKTMADMCTQPGVVLLSLFHSSCI